MSDCNVSLSKCATLKATSTRIAVWSAGGVLTSADARDMPVYVRGSAKAAIVLARRGNNGPRLVADLMRANGRDFEAERLAFTPLGSRNVESGLVKPLH